MTQVLFKFKGKFAKSCGGKIHAMYRKFAMVEKFEKPADKAYWVCDLGDFTTFVFEKVADHAAKIVEVAEAAKAAVEAAKNAKPTMDADMDENKEKPMEGAADGDAMVPEMEAPM